MSDLYLRQKELNLKVPEGVMVVGCGGVGSWVGLFSALAGVENILLVDPDVIEEHNLNRTPFTQTQVGQNKAEALGFLIKERRPGVQLGVVPLRVEDLVLIAPAEAWAQIPVVFDCRDTSEPLPDFLKGKTPIVGGYNGNSITLHTWPDLRPTPLWGAVGQGYNTPSWVAPPTLLASLLIFATFSYDLPRQTRISTLTMQDVFDRVMAKRWQ